MEILWLVIGIVIGLLVAWVFLNARCSKQLSEQRAKLSETNRRVEQALEQEHDAHAATKQRLSEVEAKGASTTKQIAALNAELDAGRAELESAKADAAEKSTHLSQLQSQSHDLEARLDAADVALKKAEGDRDNAIDDSKSQIVALEARLRAQEESTARLENEHAELEASLKNAQEDRDAARDDGRSQITALESRLRDREEEIARLEAELAALRAKSEDPARASPPEIGSQSAPHSVAEAAATGPTDDLMKIKGIGPVLQEKLHGLGITSFQQIADFTQADVDRVNQVLDFPGRIERERWVEQAQAMVQGGSIN